jgi:hypothetical protein
MAAKRGRGKPGNKDGREALEIASAVAFLGELKDRGGEMLITGTPLRQLLRRGWTRSQIDRAVERLAHQGVVEVHGCAGDVVVWLNTEAAKGTVR